MGRRRGNGSGKLTDEQKAFLVQRLAVFDTPKQSAEALKAEFGVEISPQGAEAYDPNKRAGARLAGKWQELFESTREAFLTDLSTSVPIANKAVRLNKLQKAVTVFESQHNYVAMAAMLEQAAKEVGGLFTNRREYTGKEGGPIKYQDVERLSDDELRAEMIAAGLNPDDYAATRPAIKKPH